MTTAQYLDNIRQRYKLGNGVEQGILKKSIDLEIKT
jgi:hypothetical protein